MWAALAETFNEACVMLFLIRGKLIGSEHCVLKDQRLRAVSPGDYHRLCQAVL